MIQEKKIQIKPTWKQHLAYQKLKDNIILFLMFGGGAGGGKSWLGCEWNLQNCYLYPGYKGFIGRNELKRLMGSTYITWRKVCKYHQIPKDDWKLNGQYNYIEFINGSRIDLLDLKYQPRDPDYERFGSLEYTNGWIEEGGEVNFGAFDVLKSRIGRHLNSELRVPPKMLITTNPKKNWEYQLIYKPYKENRLPQAYAFIQSLYGDNPYTAEKYGKILAQIKDKATKQRLMQGNWEYEDDPNTLIEYDAILDLFTNTVDDKEDKFLIGDIARYGQDKTVIMLWKGYLVYKIIVWEKQGLDVTQDKIKELLAKEKIPYSHCLIDEEGIGGGIVDNLRGIKGFVGNSSPIHKTKNIIEKENYRNLKTQCTFILAEEINKHNIALRCEDQKIKTWIIEDLEQMRRKDADKEGKLQIIPKEEIKETLGRSTDFGDCLLMRMYYKINKIGESLYTPQEKAFYEKMQAKRKQQANKDFKFATTTY